MRVYLDHNATTPLDPRVHAEMQRPFFESFGNPASAFHAWAWEAEELVEIAGDRIARALGVGADEIVYTSGATESINLALRGWPDLSGRLLVTTPIEHSAVVDNVRYLNSQSINSKTLGVNQQGVVDLGELEDLLKQNVGKVFVSIIAGNNEIGVIQDLEGIARLCKESEAILHLDITQCIGALPLKLKEWDIGLASFSGHKIYGPKGVGGLYVKKGLRPNLKPLILGGGHQGGLRSGTINVPGVVGLGMAAKLVIDEFDTGLLHLKTLREKLLLALKTEIEGLSLNGHGESRLPGNLNIVLPRVPAAAIIAKLASKVALSASSACTSGSQGGSHVLKAIGLSADQIKSSIRLCVGRFNTEAEIDLAAKEIVEAYKSLLK